MALLLAASLTIYLGRETQSVSVDTLKLQFGTTMIVGMKVNFPPADEQRVKAALTSSARTAALIGLPSANGTDREAFIAGTLSVLNHLAEIEGSLTQRNADNEITLSFDGTVKFKTRSGNYLGQRQIKVTSMIDTQGFAAGIADIDLVVKGDAYNILYKGGRLDSNATKVLSKQVIKSYAKHVFSKM